LYPTTVYGNGKSDVKHTEFFMCELTRRGGTGRAVKINLRFATLALLRK